MTTFERRSTASPHPVPPSTTNTVRTRIGRLLIAVAALGALASAVNAVFDVQAASGATVVVESWRGYGFLVLAALMALLAWRPHGYPGVWEIVILHKVALIVTTTVFAVHGGITDTGVVIAGNAVVLVLLVAAYVLLRAWPGAVRTHLLTPERKR